MNNEARAILALVPNAKFQQKPNGTLVWADTRTQPTEEELQAKIVELEAAEPMRLLRMERNKLIAQTDWMANSDVTMSDAWKGYRQALRDLPANSPNVALDEQGNLINVTWPTKPE